MLSALFTRDRTGGKRADCKHTLWQPVEAFWDHDFTSLETPLKKTQFRASVQSRMLVLDGSWSASSVPEFMQAVFTSCLCLFSPVPFQCQADVLDFGLF